ncbi:Group 3 secretory phospholipase A2 [Bagarius yarrelli]|uniref:phospholipase A2 n=1 Tax=Bagarius yarrelli TaxID=175774 RepID=A0A556U368_BAGYA|nr:Group 3 secretory phospholipase A2 [Bagarius yarrelli]
MLVEPDGPCATVGPLPDLEVPVRRSRDVDRRTVSQNKGGRSKTPKRSKRALMIPGTLWCGSGNKASNLSDLGLFEETDKCCREHDHCEQTIASFEFNYGIFNTNFFTLSHCACDSKFRQCLHSANDRMSDVVGYGYFNVLKMRCFEFSQKMTCAQWTWWGMCKHSKMTIYAFLKEAIDYNSTIMEDEKLDLSLYHTVSFGDLTVTNDLVMSSDIVTKDASQKHSSVSVPQRLPVTVNRSQQPERHEKTLRTHVTNSPEMETTDSETKLTNSPMIITDLKQGQTADSFKSAITYLPLTQSDSHITQTTTFSDNSEITDSTYPEKTDLPNTETTDSSNLETSSTPETTDSSNLETSSTPKTTDSSNLETSSTPKTTDLSNVETSSTPKTKQQTYRITGILDSSQPDLTETNPTKARTTDPTKTRKTDTTEFMETQTDVPKTKKTDLTEAKKEDTLLIDSVGLSKTQTDSTTDSPKMQLRQGKGQKDKLDTCEGYKDLDSCHYQIAALQEKFGLQNAEHTTMYHCNCTARLAKELAEEDDVDKVHFWLLDFVSRSCFILPQNCTGTESCSSSSNDTPLIEQWSNSAAVWRHLAVPRRKNKRFNNKRSKRKDFSIRLYKKCLRMYTKLYTTKTFIKQQQQQQKKDV